MGYRKLQENDEEVLEVFAKHKCISKKDAKDLEKNYPHNIKSFKRNLFIDKSGRCITDRGKSAFTQHEKTGRFWVMPLKDYKRIKKRR